MFFIMSVTEKCEQLNYHEVTECPVCGKFGAAEVYMTYSCFSMFFLPLVKFNRRYQVRMNCCGAGAALPKETGEAIRAGGGITVPPEVFDKMVKGKRTCPNCGFSTSEDYDFCPYCGHPMM